MRHIGVVYRPRTELQSHYINGNLIRQFDSVIHVDDSTGPVLTILSAAQLRRRLRRLRLRLRLGRLLLRLLLLLPPHIRTPTHLHTPAHRHHETNTATNTH